MDGWVDGWNTAIITVKHHSRAFICAILRPPHVLAEKMLMAFASPENGNDTDWLGSPLSVALDDTECAYRKYVYKYV